MVEEHVRETFAKLYKVEVPAGGIGLDEPLFGPDSSYGLDSLDTLRFMVALQEKYKFDVGGCGPDTFRTLRSITQFVAA